MKKVILYISFTCGVLLFYSLSLKEKTFPISENTTVWEALLDFGQQPPNHLPDENISGASAERGEEIVKGGVTSKPKGGKISLQSKHFVCTSCHNVEKEFSDLLDTSPEARLQYASEKNIPFLQGTTLFGAVNRSSFYNGDYEKKYGELVEPARDNLREAIQLCAVECSQGRRLKDWELESVLKYLWTLELKISDLNLSANELQKLNDLKDNNSADTRAEALNFIQSKYRQKSPAHFVAPPEDRKEGYDYIGNPESGKLIYELSCLHCHSNENFSTYNLDNSKNSFKYLEKHFEKYSRYSVYQVARYGTSPLPGKRAYMPQYTEEKMSDQQMEDLRAYIEQAAQ